MREDPKGSDGTQPGQSFSSHRPGREDTKYGGSRNKRDVWTVSTKPYSDAHFAVYPPDLIEPCVKAGSAAGDTVLDPFCGAGTTGLVALAKGRDFVGIDISRDYCEMAADRIRRDAPLCNDVEIEGDVPHAE
jgi:DNA modification methylase